MRKVVLIAILAGSFSTTLADDIQLRVSRGQVALDQANLASTGNFVLGPGPGIRQTFTAGAAGRITGIEIAPLLDSLAPSDPVFLDVAAPGGGYRTVTMTAAGFPPGGGSIPAPLDSNLKGPGYFDVSGLGIDVGVGQVVEFVLRNGTASGVCGTTHVCTAGKIGASCFSNSQCDKVFRAGFNQSQYAGGAGTHPSNPTLNFDLAFKTLLRTGMQESVTLDWTGGLPSFQVYRSATPVQVVQAAHRLGGTAGYDWGDTPPAGTIFFYQVTACVFNPPEICDGLDNDCDGVVDGPGSASSCNLPHATPVCTGGSCVIASCAADFSDCNTSPADGCESDLRANPNCGSCGVDCNSGLGACARSNCANGVCQPGFNAAACAAPIGNTNSAGNCAFANANCPGAIDSDGDGLSDTWEDAGMIDINCDGTFDASDVILPRANKHVKDVYLKIAYMAGSPSSYPPLLSCSSGLVPEPPDGHKPKQESIDFAIRAFAGAHLNPVAKPCGLTGVNSLPDPPCAAGFSCVDFACLPFCTTDADCAPSCNQDCQSMGGAHCVPRDGGGGNVCRLWRLHVDPLPSAGVEHHDIVTFVDLDPLCANTTGGGSGTPDDQANYFDYKAANFDPREAAFKHFVLFAHDNTCYGFGSPGCGHPSCPLILGQRPVPNTTGISEIKGNDSIVSLGVHQLLTSGQPRSHLEAGALLHELGHNLGLYHGGSDPQDTVVKVNYLSSMNVLYFNGIPLTSDPSLSIHDGGTRLDYSHSQLSMVLDESNLSDIDGVGGIAAPYATDLIRYYVDASSGACGLCPDDACGNTQSSCYFLTSGAVINGQVTPIDWGCDGSVFDIGVVSDINGSNSATELHDPTGTADWISLFYEFQCEPNYLDFAPWQLAAAFPEPQYSELAFLRPQLIARLTVEPTCLEVVGEPRIQATLFGSAELDVTMVDLSKLRLGPAPAITESFRIEDFDGDGQPDLTGNFIVDPQRITETNSNLYMTGSLRNGRTFNARDTINLDGPPALSPPAPAPSPPPPSSRTASPRG